MVRHTRAAAWITLCLLLLGVHPALAGSFSTGSFTTPPRIRLGSGSGWLAQDTGSSSAVTVGGATFAAESYFTGVGTNPFSSPQSFADPGLNTLISSVRYDATALTDSLPVTPGDSYVLQLLFDDLTFTTPGTRVMTITAGTDVLSGFDPNVITGGNNSTTGAFVDYRFTAIGSTLAVTIATTSSASAILNGFSLATVPEPSTFAMLIVGGIGLAALRLRRNSRLLRARRMTDSSGLLIEPDPIGGEF